MKKILSTIFIFVLFSVSLLSSAQAYYNPGEPSGFVNDYANMMSDNARQTLERELIVFERETGHEISVVTVPNLGEDYIENFAVELFADWGIGKQGADNGILLLVAEEERELRIEVGYGLEGALTDSEAGAIIRTIAVPNFKAGDYDTGIIESARALQAVARGEVLDLPEEKEKGSLSGNFIFYLVVFSMIMMGGFFEFLGKSKRYWPGGLWGLGLGALAGALIAGTLWAIILGGLFSGLGLLFDWGASRRNWFKGWSKGKGGRGGGIFFGGGGRSGGSGGFGGFGGGMSGGGGSSGSW